MLTPNHLVFGRTTSPMPYGEGQLEDEEDPTFEPDDEEVRRQWRRMATRLNIFKQQFAEEYMAYLRERHKIQHHEDPLEPVPVNVGDLVIMKSETEKRSLWDKAIVTEILPSSDGKIRAVRLRTKTGPTTRPIVKLVPLLTHPELQGKPANAADDADAADAAGVANTGDGNTDGQDQPGDAQQQGDPEARPTSPAPPPTPMAAPAQTRPRRSAGVAGRERVQTWCRDILED